MKAITNSLDFIFFHWLRNNFKCRSCLPSDTLLIGMILKRVRKGTLRARMLGTLASSSSSFQGHWLNSSEFRPDKAAPNQGFPLLNLLFFSLFSSELIQGSGGSPSSRKSHLGTIQRRKVIHQVLISRIWLKAPFGVIPLLFRVSTLPAGGAMVSRLRRVWRPWNSHWPPVVWWELSLLRFFLWARHSSDCFAYVSSQP